MLNQVKKIFNLYKYKKYELLDIMKYQIFVHKNYKNDLQNKLDAFITISKLLGYDIDFFKEKFSTKDDGIVVIDIHDLEILYVPKIRIAFYVNNKKIHTNTSILINRGLKKEKIYHYKRYDKLIEHLQELHFELG